MHGVRVAPVLERGRDWTGYRVRGGVGAPQQSEMAGPSFLLATATGGRWRCVNVHKAAAT